MGIIAAGGGGMGLGMTSFLVGSGVAGAVGTGVALTGGDEDTTTTTVSGGGGTTTTPGPQTTTTAPTTGLRACFTTDPDPAVITAGDRISLDGRCSQPEGLVSFMWDLGDGRTRDTAFIGPTYRNPGEYTVTLTVQFLTATGTGTRPRVDESTVSKVVTVREPVTACFHDSTPPIGTTNFRVTTLDASCSSGPISSYEWVIDPGNSGPDTRSGQVVTYEWFVTPTPSTTFVTLTVSSAAGATDTTSRIVTIISPEAQFLEEKDVSTSFTSYLGVPGFDGRARGQVLLNESQIVNSNNSAPTAHHVQGRLGENTVEAYATTPLEAPGFWRFDFKGAPNFVARSLEAQQGEVISIDSHSIVFRLSGTTGERVKFTYQLLP
jgi:hypothetical protein